MGICREFAPFFGAWTPAAWLSQLSPQTRICKAATSRVCHASTPFISVTPTPQKHDDRAMRCTHAPVDHRTKTLTVGLAARPVLCVPPMKADLTPAATLVSSARLGTLPSVQRTYLDAGLSPTTRINVVKKPPARAACARNESTAAPFVSFWFLRCLASPRQQHVANGPVETRTRTAPRATVPCPSITINSLSLTTGRNGCSPDSDCAVIQCFLCPPAFDSTQRNGLDKANAHCSCELSSFDNPFECHV